LYLWYAKKSAYDYYAVRMGRKNGKRVTIYMHNFLLGCVGKEQGHHKNGNTLDNQSDNLEKCTQGKNLSYRQWGC
jgi:hypothetical protein